MKKKYFKNKFSKNPKKKKKNFEYKKIINKYYNFQLGYQKKINYIKK